MKHETGHPRVDWIEVILNGAKARAAICTGNQASVISLRAAQSLRINYPIDYRFVGKVHGLAGATTAIVGRIHHTMLQIGGRSSSVALTVLEHDYEGDEPKRDFYLGLDFMKKHDAVVDCSRKVVVIQGVEVPLV
ncbi:hypothetical protein PG996_002764 [Apiospora saccharicola]|uniref:Aspartic peptidase DDI1-type domain-containing protein n=1 Tax=Apiospora saccharicola TaxID=335842 RepID=A0ABR1WKE9_9PEZI